MAVSVELIADADRPLVYGTLPLHETQHTRCATVEPHDACTKQGVALTERNTTGPPRATP